MKTMIFSNIPVVPKRDMILLRLGYKKNITILDQKQCDIIENSIKLGLSLCNLQGIMGRCKIVERHEEYIILEGGTKLCSRDLSALLFHSDEVLLMASTAGSGVVDRIAYEVKSGDAALGVIMDSVASQATDASITWIKDFADKMVMLEGKRVTRHRYSPGFKDFSLIYQKTILELLQLQKIGLYSSEKFMLLPEKSVIAVAGIEINECRENKNNTNCI